jgi:hypothetical protein
MEGKLRTPGFILVLLAASWTHAQTATYPPSQVITGITFEFATLVEYAPGSDNWVITWADDGHQYTSWGDGGGFGGDNNDGRVSMGVARVEGDRDGYAGFNVWGGKNPENPATFAGKSYGILSVGTTLYMWRCGSGSNASAFEIQDLYRSSDHAATWTATGVDYRKSDFSGNDGFFALTFLQFGQAYTQSRDDHVYVYAPENQDNQWNVQKPGAISLIRVLKEQLEDRASYEYFAGLDGNDNPSWTSNVDERQPVFEDAANGVMRTSVSHNQGLGRYLLITQQVDRFENSNGHIGIYDAPEPWGPWTTVLFQNAWDAGLQTGSKTVYWNFSNKWLSPDGKSFVMVYTGQGADNWGTVEGTFTVQDPDSIPPSPPQNLTVAGG